MKTKLLIAALIGMIAGCLLTNYASGNFNSLPEVNVVSRANAMTMAPPGKPPIRAYRILERIMADTGKPEEAGYIVAVRDGVDRLITHDMVVGAKTGGKLLSEYLIEDSSGKFIRRYKENE